MDHAIAMDPLDATQPTVAMEPAGTIEPCPHCGAQLTLDQRYCLECGAPRTYLSGMLLERLQTPSAQASSSDIQLPSPGGRGALQAQSSSSAWQRGSVVTLIAGVGVLLLAMGVGVLIGRSGDSGSSASPAPQVISVGGASTGVAGTSTTPSAPEQTAAAKSGAAAAAAAAAVAAKHKAKVEKSSGVGSSPSKPAPPTVLKNLRTGSGQNYEQKSKNLPNVVSTG
jgi:hypothetical protein